MLRRWQGTCEKCNTLWSELFLYNDRWLCNSNSCLDEEIEKDSPKIDADLEWLEQYRQACAGTVGIIASTYSQ